MLVGGSTGSLLVTAADLRHLVDPAGSAGLRGLVREPGVLW